MKIKFVIVYLIGLCHIVCMNFDRTAIELFFLFISIDYKSLLYSTFFIVYTCYFPDIIKLYHKEYTSCKMIDRVYLTFIPTYNLQLSNNMLIIGKIHKLYQGW